MVSQHFPAVIPRPVQPPGRRRLEQGSRGVTARDGRTAVAQAEVTGTRARWAAAIAVYVPGRLTWSRWGRRPAHP